MIRPTPITRRASDLYVGDTILLDIVWREIRWVERTANAGESVLHFSPVKRLTTADSTVFIVGFKEPS